MTRANRTSLVRWFGACAALCIGATLLVAWQANQEIHWAPVVWLPVVMGFCVLTGMRLQRDPAPDGASRRRPGTGSRRPSISLGWMRCTTG